jgi:hypothetical protein
MYFYYAVIMGTMGCFYKLDGWNICKEQCKSYSRQWGRLNNLVSMKHKHQYLIIWTSLKLLAQAFYLSFLQWLNSSLKKIDRNTYEISYIINGKLYKMRVKPQKGPKPVLQVIDECSEDVTTEVLQYLGPNYDWHNSNLSPKILGFESLTFECSDGEEAIFTKNETMKKFKIELF